MNLFWKPAVALYLLVSLAAFIYEPGLKGGFLFDDFTNLDDLGALGGVVDWETLKAFVFNGSAGPSGRPLSLLSFLLDDNTWPSEASWFKPTNLLFHLLCGLLLCWATLLILRQQKFGEKESQWMAVFSSSCWLLHPLFVSTTLYVVQRMAQLSTLFIFAGIVGYMLGRSLLPRRRRAAYVWMSLSVGLGTLLSVLCKENGALLPLLLLSIEFCASSKTEPPSRLWRGVFLTLPSLALLVYLASLIDFSANPWPTRSFNQVERLFSESRILMDYIRGLFIPQVEGRGLFQDGYEVSKGWLQPWTTLPSVLAVLGLGGFALALRRRYPLVSLAILFFFGGQLLESSVVGLELYFEHRNYLSAAFAFLPLAWGLERIRKRISPAFVLLIAVCCLSMLSFLTWQRVQLWKETDRLELYWANANPKSARAQNSIAGYLLRAGRRDDAVAHLEAAIERLPNSALLNLALLLQKVYTHKAVEADFSLAGERLRTQAADPQAILAIRKIVDRVVEPEAPRSYPRAMVLVVDDLTQNPNFARFPEMQRLVPYLKGRLFFADLDLEEGCRQFNKAMPLYANVGTGLLMAAEAASYRAYDCSLMLLDETEELLKVQPDRVLLHSRSVYQREIEQLRSLIQKDRTEWDRRH